MNPNETPQTPQAPVGPGANPVPNQTPQPTAAQPAAPATPAVAPTPNYAKAAPPANTYPATMAPAKKSKKVFVIVGSVVGALVMLILLGILLLAIPAVQSQAFASAFMKDLTSGDAVAATKEADPEFTSSFISSAASDLKGSSPKIIGSAYDSKSESFYLFSLSNNAKYKYARIGVTKSDKRLVTSIAYDSQKLRLVPGAATTSKLPATTSNESTTMTETPATSVASTGKCLGANDFFELNPYPIDQSADGKYAYGDNIFFKADSTEYNYASIMDEIFAKYKAFYSSQQAKDFTIQLQGQVFSATPDTALANQRAAKVKADFIAKSSIPDSRLSVIPPTNTLNEDNSAARNVDIIIQSSDSCTP